MLSGTFSDALIILIHIHTNARNLSNIKKHKERYKDNLRKDVFTVTIQRDFDHHFILNAGVDDHNYQFYESEILKDVVRNIQ